MSDVLIPLANQPDGDRGGRAGSAEPTINAGCMPVLSASEEACGRTALGSNANPTTPRPNRASVQQESQNMEIQQLENLKDRIDSFIARTNTKEMFFALGIHHGEIYGRRAPYREQKYLDAFQERPGMYFGDAEIDYLTQECDILSATTVGEGSRLSVDDNTKREKSLERAYIDGFVLGALIGRDDSGSGDLGLF